MMTFILSPNNQTNVVHSTPIDPLNMGEDFYNYAFRNVSFSRKNLSTDPFKVDVQEKENAYIVYAELPGVRKEDIETSLNNQQRLTISIRSKARTSEHYQTKQPALRNLDWQRTVFLPYADPDITESTFKHDILTVRVGKQHNNGASEKLQSYSVI